MGLSTLSSRLSLFVLAVLVNPAFAAVQEVWWNVTYVLNANPDGLYERRVIGVNNTWPPPPLEVNTNNSLLVHVTNSLDQPTTLHHHGMFFNATSWMDGAASVSQCGIPPGEQFDYYIPVNSSGQWGTYWVHAHASGHYVDGLRAPLLLHPQTEVQSYDDEFTVVLGDWYHTEHSELLQQFISIANPGGAEPIPDSALIYFSHNGMYLPPISGTSPSQVTSAVGFNENSTLPFQPGKIYRLRIINTSAFSAFFFWIDGHEMRIIEVDGTDVEESTIDLLGITVAQRYSVLVTARNDTSSNWAIHANLDVAMFDHIPPELNPNITSSITYNTTASIQDLGAISAYHDVNDTALVPIPAIAQPLATKTISLEVKFATMDDGTNRAMFNGVTYNPPLVPAVFSELTLGGNATVAGAYGPSSFVIEYGDVIDLVVQNGDSGKHPFHLHGHKPMIVGRSEDYTSNDPELNPPIVEGQANPIRRDTVQIPSGQSATLRVVADNPGVWFLHCHIEWHLEAGLAVQLVEAPLQAQAASKATFPSVLNSHCAALNLPYTGNAAGHNSVTDLSGLKLGPYQQILGWRPKGIVAMTGCVLAAVLGILSVFWYTLGVVDEDVVEREVREQMEKKDKRQAERGRQFFGFRVRKVKD